MVMLGVRAQAGSAKAMNSAAYYARMQSEAAAARTRYGITDVRVGLADLRRIYSKEKIKIDLSDTLSNRIRGAYFYDELGATVLLNKKLPIDPRVFTMAHELKHHLFDQDRLVVLCGLDNETKLIEIGAEVFAGEFLFPQQQFIDYFSGHTFTPEELVHLKVNTRTTLSYAGLVKHAERLGLVQRGSLRKVAWKKLEESIYGVPYYKQRLAATGRART
jgi:Zn-dependent peptidase ImmA (M78 family)